MKRHKRGFTLLELLIAISIFALIGLATYTMLNRVLHSDAATWRYERQLRELIRAIAVLETDVEQMGPRAILDSSGEPRPALLGQGGPVMFEFTRLGWRNPQKQQRSAWQRVRWEISDDILKRSYWSVLDQAPTSVAQQQNVLQGIDSLVVRYLDHDDRWLNHWPPEHSHVSLSALPRALEVTLIHASFGKIVRLLQLPDPQGRHSAPPQNSPTVSVELPKDGAIP